MSTLLMEWVIIFLVLTSGAYWAFTVRQSAKDGKRGAPKRSTSKPTTTESHNAVSIKFCEQDACHAVKAIGAQRFLTNEAPTFPLAECNAGRCDCKYVRYDDRRTEDEDRRLIGSLQSLLHDATGRENRSDKSGDRRANE